MPATWTVTALRAAFAAAGDRPPLPEARDSAAWLACWSGALGARRRELLEEALAATAGALPPLDRERYGEYERTGERLPYERIYLARRARLAWLAIALAADAAANDAWPELIGLLTAILAEPSWCLPAHARMRDDLREGAVPDPDRPVVDLFAADTAAQMAEVLDLLGDALARRAPELVGRIGTAIERQVLEPVLAVDFWWLRGTNNWTPWCCAMVWLAAAHRWSDPDRLARLAQRLLAAAEGYLAALPEDGSCEEGPQYWCVSPPMLFLFAETLRERSGGRIDLSADPRLARAAGYLPRLHLGRGAFPWFSDGRPVLAPRLGLCWRYARVCGCPRLAELIGDLVRGFAPHGPPRQAFSDLASAARSGAPLVHLLRDLLWLGDSAADHAGGDALVEDDWMPAGQVLVARSAGDGFALATKGGCTATSHGHLDLGQVVIARGGRPLLVDAGVGTYRAALFGANRFAQPWVRAADHASPRIAGIGQVHGEDRAARVLDQGRTGGRTSVAFDLRGAYPAAAALRRVERRVQLDREADEVTVEDLVEADGGPTLIELDLLFAVPIRLLAPGSLLLEAPGAAVQLDWDASVLDAEIAEEPLDDPALVQGWGRRLFRLQLRGGGEGAMRYRLRWRPAPESGRDAVRLTAPAGAAR